MAEDPVEDEFDDLTLDENMQDNIENITVVDPTDEWIQFRLNMAGNMFNAWQSS